MGPLLIFFVGRPVPIRIAPASASRSNAFLDDVVIGLFLQFGCSINRVARLQTIQVTSCAFGPVAARNSIYYGHNKGDHCLIAVNEGIHIRVMFWTGDHYVPMAGVRFGPFILRLSNVGPLQASLARNYGAYRLRGGVHDLFPVPVRQSMWALVRRERVGA